MMLGGNRTGSEGNHNTHTHTRLGRHHEFLFICVSGTGIRLYIKYFILTKTDDTPWEVCGVDRSWKVKMNADWSV